MSAYWRETMAAVLKFAPALAPRAGFPCSRCRAKHPELSLCLGVFRPAGASTFKKFPIGQPLCPAYFAEQGLPETVELVPTIGEVS